jgi:hypothetical protein
MRARDREALARALRLDDTERAHLSTLHARRTSCVLQAAHAAQTAAVLEAATVGDRPFDI